MVADDPLVVRATVACRLVVVSNIAAALREHRSATTRVATEQSQHIESADQEVALLGQSRNRHTSFSARARISPWTSRPRQYDASTTAGHVHPRPGERDLRARVDHGSDQMGFAPLPSAAFEVRPL